MRVRVGVRVGARVRVRVGVRVRVRVSEVGASLRFPWVGCALGEAAATCDAVCAPGEQQPPG